MIWLLTYPKQILKGLVFLYAILGTAAVPAWAGFIEGQAAYERGDYTAAMREWLPLAENGDIDAQYSLGLMHFHGIGVRQEFSEAVKWFRLAAEQGSPAAQLRYGKMYWLGQGLAQDLPRAYFWFSLAMPQLQPGETRDQAMGIRNSVRLKLTRAQITKILQEAMEWRPRTQIIGDYLPVQNSGQRDSEIASSFPAQPSVQVLKSPSDAKTLISQKETRNPSAGQSAASAQGSTELAIALPAPDIASASVHRDSTGRSLITPSKPTDSPEAAIGRTRVTYFVQVASVRTSDSARREWARLQKAHSGLLGHLTPIFRTAKLGARGDFVRIQIGPYQNLKIAKEACSKLKAKNQDCLVISR